MLDKTSVNDVRAQAFDLAPRPSTSCRATIPVLRIKLLASCRNDHAEHNIPKDNKLESIVKGNRDGGILPSDGNQSRISRINNRTLPMIRGTRWRTCNVRLGVEGLNRQVHSYHPPPSLPSLPRITKCATHPHRAAAVVNGSALTNRKLKKRPKHHLSSNMIRSIGVVSLQDA